MFRFKISTNLRFGIGEIVKLGEEIKEFGFTKVAAVVDKAAFSYPQIKESLDALKQICIRIDIFKNGLTEPTYDYLEIFKDQLLGRDYDCLVGIGGGSTIDLTKGIALLLTNEGSAISFRGFPRLKKKPIAVIAIPTTAGSGSEATYNAVFTDAKEKRKLGINSILNFPVCAIVDPALTIGCPKSVTVSSGGDALIHALESFVNKNHTSISRMYSKEAFRLLFNNLMKVLATPQDIQVRSCLSLGAHLAGIALINSGPGVGGAFSYPLGAVYNVPHGYAGAVFLSSVVKTNIEKGYLDYAQLYDLIESTDRDKPIKLKNIEFLKKIQKLMDKLEIARSLSIFGLKQKDIEFMIEQYDLIKDTIALNPIEISKEDISKMMTELA